MRLKVKEMREARRLTQTELSRRSGVPQAQISMIENGIVPNPQINTLYNLADAMHCLVDDLISADNPSHDRTA